MNHPLDYDERYPEFTSLIRAVCSQNPFQRKQIETFVSAQAEDYFEFSEDLIQKLGQSLLPSEEAKNSAARAYNSMCLEMLRQEIAFRKTGHYPHQSAEYVREQIYDQYSDMKDRIIGLLFTYFLWPNHYHMFSLYKNYLKDHEIIKYLEIGAGHGLFLAEAFSQNARMNATVIDVSRASLDVAADILDSFGVRSSSLNMIHGDFLTIDLPQESFDFIVLGEVIEHVEDPLIFLRSARKLLSAGGVIYMTTCANCPSVDHVYHFKNVDEIRELISEAGLAIEMDDAVGAHDVSPQAWEAELVPVNYSSFLHVN